MKPTNLLLIFFMILAGETFAQNHATISGKVIDKTSDEPLPFANIVLYHEADTVSFAGTISDENGIFVLKDLESGNYKIKISCLGYKPVNKGFIVGELNRNLDLGKIVLTESSLLIDDVVVTGQRQTVSSAIDRKHYSTEDLLSKANGSVLDAMKLLPGVTVDQESRILLRGSDKVVILIDGKQSALTGFGDQKGLENIPASQVESIEVINNPSAKYDAAGMAGIVNIKFKEHNKKGFNGDFGFTYGLGQLSKRKADLPTGMSSYSLNPKYTPTLNLNYKTDNINFYLSGTYRYQKKLPNNEFSTRRYPHGDIMESQVAENRSQNYYNIKLGFDWDISENQKLTIFGLYDYEWHIDTTRVWYFQNKDYNSPIRKWSFNESEGTGFSNVTVQHRYKFSQPGHELFTQYLFTKGWEDETYNLYQERTDGFSEIRGDKTNVTAPEYVHQISTDYVKPLSFGRFEAGAQARFRNMPIDYTMTRAAGNTALIFDFGDWSKWREDIAGLYVNLVSELKYLNIEAGLRGEYTNVLYEFAPNQYFKNDSYDYFKLFPNIRFTIKADKNNRISLFYNRRIDRPNEGILRIFPKYDDPELLKVGNPKLRPQITDGLELAYRLLWDGGSFYSAAYFKNISDYYTRIYIQDPTHSNITIKGYDNIERATNLGLEINIDQKITKFWKMNINGNVYSNTIYGYTGEIDFPTPVQYTIEKRKDSPWFAKMNNVFTVSSRVKCELSGVYFSQKNIPQGKELSRWGIDFGVKVACCDNKLELILSGNDLFNTMGIRQKIDQNSGYYTDYENFYETQLISAGIKYKF